MIAMERWWKCRNLAESIGFLESRSSVSSPTKPMCFPFSLIPRVLVSSALLHKPSAHLQIPDLCQISLRRLRSSDRGISICRLTDTQSHSKPIHEIQRRVYHGHRRRTTRVTFGSGWFQLKEPQAWFNLRSQRRSFRQTFQNCRAHRFRDSGVLDFSELSVHRYVVSTDS